MKKKLFGIVFATIVILLMSTTAFAMSGEGTENNPYLIETEEDFSAITNSTGKYYKLMSDVSIEESLGNFNGTLDGNSFTLSTTQNYIFESNSGAIKNLTVASGILVDRNENNGILDNCKTLKNMLFLTNNGDVKNSTTNNTMLGDINYGTITGCSAVFDENYNLYTLSLITDNYGSVKSSNCVCNDVEIIKSTGLVSQTDISLSFDGICENNYETGEISQCFTSGSIYLWTTNNNTGVHSAYTYFYGICRTNRGTVSQSYSDCDVILRASASNSQAFSISSFSGICGMDGAGVVENCYSKGSCHISTANYVYVRGISNASGKVTNCHSTTNVSIPNNVGSNYRGIYGVGGKERSSSYYLADNMPSNSTNSDKYGISKTSDELKIQSTYESWNFETIWGIDSEKNDGYPYLKWQFEESIHPEDTTTYTLGDTNNDGTIDVRDVMLMRRYIAGGYGVQLLEKVVDVNQDGEIDTQDIIFLRRFIAGGYGVELK